MGLGRRRHRSKPADEVIDLRRDEEIDLRSKAPEHEPDAGYRCTTIRRSGPAPAPPQPSAWERSASLVQFPSDLDDWIADRRRDSLEPGDLSAAVLEALAEDDLGPLAHPSSE